MERDSFFSVCHVPGAVLLPELKACITVPGLEFEFFILNN